MTTVVYCEKRNEFCIEEVCSLLLEVDDSRVSTQIAQKPKGGDVYVYRHDDTTKNDWVADGYRWLHVGCDRLPRRQPVLYKRKFQTLKRNGPSSEFKRVAYRKFEPESSQYIVVHYIGDETVAEDFPHGNVKNCEEARPFQCTAPSVFALRAPNLKVKKLSELKESSGLLGDNISYKSYCRSEVNEHIFEESAI